LPFIVLLIIVCLAPLPFGAVQIWAWSAMAALVGALLAAWAVPVGLGRMPLAGWSRLRWPLAALALVAVWVVLQVLPVTPPAWHHPIWAMGGEALGARLPGRVAIDPQEGLFALIRLLTYGAVFWLAAQYGRDARRAALALRVLTVTAGASAGLGLLMWAAGINEFLWFHKDFVLSQAYSGGRLAIPFVNPNHLASFAGMGLICGTGLLAGETRGLWRRETPPTEKLRRFFESVVTRRWYLVASCVVLVAVLLLTGSRGGVISTAVGLLVMAAATMRRSRPRAGRLLAGGIVASLVAAAVFAPSLARFADRVVSTDMGADQRIAIYTNTLQAIEASPWLGYGYGGFPSLYRFYERGDLTKVVDAAHSTVLENIAELGLPAALVLFAAILLPVAWCWIGAGARHRDQYFPAIAAGVGVAGVIHSMVDFPLQIPAIATVFSFILGIGFAQSISSRVD
jgi:O-antigen ligase